MIQCIDCQVEIDLKTGKCPECGHQCLSGLKSLNITQENGNLTITNKGVKKIWMKMN